MRGLGWATALLVVASLICFVVGAVRARVTGAVVLAFPLFNFFALDMLTHAVHTHTRYSESGLVRLTILAPTIAVLVCPAGVSFISGRKRLAGQRYLGRASWLNARRVFSLPMAGIVAAAAVLVVLPIWGGVQRELAVFDVLFYPWLGVYQTRLEGGRLVPRWSPDRPDQVSRKLDALRELGYAPAAVSLYGAWTHRKYADWVWSLDAQGNPAPHLTGVTAKEVQEWRRESLKLSQALFERALEEDPDNPLLPAQAMLVYGMEYPRAVPIFKKALDRWPDHPFGGFMALNLQSQTGGKERERYAQEYERRASRFLHMTARNRPGFLAIPPLKTKGLVIHKHKSGLLVTVPPGAEAVFGSAKMHGSTRGMLIVFAQLASGEATARLRLISDKGVRDTEPSPFQDPDLIRYRKIDWTGGDPVHRMDLVVPAGPTGATIFLGDFYPLGLAPRAPRRSLQRMNQDWLKPGAGQDSP